MCEKQCACENECACAEKKLEMLTTEMNAVFEKNLDLWNRFFGMMDKQPDMDMSYADYLTEQLEMMEEKFTEDEYKLLQQDIETIRRLDAEMERLMLKDATAADSGMQNRSQRARFQIRAVRIVHAGKPYSAACGILFPQGFQMLRGQSVHEVPPSASESWAVRRW